MEPITLQIGDDTTSTPCGLCARSVSYRPGPRLCLAESQQPVCRECTRQREPKMVDLLDLATIAEKVGRSCRHLLTPSMETLLELARAAENYNLSTIRQRKMCTSAAQE